MFALISCQRKFFVNQGVTGRQIQKQNVKPFDGHNVVQVRRKQKRRPIETCSALPQTAPRNWITVQIPKGPLSRAQMQRQSKSFTATFFFRFFIANFLILDDQKRPLFD